MYPLAHAGFAVAAARWVPRAAGRAVPPLGWVAFGALLPDLLDKPVGLALQLGEGRLLGHTLLFALAWLAAGYAWKRSWAAWPCLVGFGCLTHLLLDLPLLGTVLWPLLGAFPLRGGYDLGSILDILQRRPVLLFGEAAGAAALLLVFWRTTRERLRALRP